MKNVKQTASVELQSTVKINGNNAIYNRILEELWHQEHCKEEAERLFLEQCLKGHSISLISKAQRRDFLPKVAKEVREEDKKRRAAAKVAQKAALRYERDTKTGYFSPKKVKERRTARIMVDLALGDFISCEADPIYWEKSWTEMESLLLDVAWELPSNYEVASELLRKGANKLPTPFAKEMVFGCFKQLSRKLISNNDEAAKKGWTAAKEILRCYFALWQDGRQGKLAELLTLVGLYKRVTKQLSKWGNNPSEKQKNNFLEDWWLIQDNGLFPYLVEVYPHSEALEELYETLNNL